MGIIKRTAIRAILLTPEGRILLMQAGEPESDFRIWFAPGGGVEEGEDVHGCLRRELMEETGCGGFELGPLVWTRHHDFDWGESTVSQDEFYYLVPTLRFEPSMTTNPSETELMAFREFRWWSVDEIAGCTDLFAPRRLAQFLANIIEAGPPAEPIDVGI